MSTCTCLDLDAVAAAHQAKETKLVRRIILCAGTGCLSAGALAVRDALKVALTQAQLPVAIEMKTEPPHDAHYLGTSGCQGFCQQGPLVSVLPDNLLYCKVKPEDAAEIVATTIVGRQSVERLLYQADNGHHCRGPEEIPFYARQTRRVLKECGSLDPEDLNAYIAQGGYIQARRAYTHLTPETICTLVSDSGLRGRGGGGFPTGRKWDLCRKETGPKKYIVCNADEGDPGAFMNRSVMEGNPHSVIEGMMIAARAIGADEGYIYVRAEYPLAVERIRKAVADAAAVGLLGEDLFGTGARLTMTVMEGAGAFVCGEETALLASIEGHRGMPRPKPPFPAQSGLWGKPTTINNVETLAMAVLVLRNGPAEFKRLGTKGSAGTKTFALTGHVVNTGLIEVPFGATLREVVFAIGGGLMHQGRVLGEDGFKAVQIGGPSGGCLTRDHLDLQLDYDSLRGVGAMVGSGGMVVMSQSTCMVDIARFFMTFTQHESCGKCVPCREGTRQMLALLDDLVEGRGSLKTLELLEEIAQTVQISSLCGLGKTAPNPVLSTLRHFRKEYEAHALDHRCPAGQCKALCPPVIDPVACKGCRVCAKACPVDAISGEVKKPHVIDIAKCIKCGACIAVCKFKAIA